MKQSLKDNILDKLLYDVPFYALIGFVIMIIVLYIAMVVELIDYSAKTQKKWDEFKVEHECVKFSEIKSLGIEGWKCDDGVTYYK